MTVRSGRAWFIPVISASVIGVFTASAIAQPPAGGPPPAKVVLDPVKLETVERWREVTGELRAVRRSIVASQEQGRVVEINIDRGDIVKPGQILAKLDDELAALEVARTEATITTRQAAVAERQAILEKSKRDQKRLEESAAMSGASAKELDDKATAVLEWEAKLSQVRADLLWAQADLRRAQKNLKDMTILAPFEGVVVRKITEVGQWVSDGDPVLEIVSLGQIDAWLDVPENVLARLAAGGTAEGGSAGMEVQINVPAIALHLAPPAAASQPAPTDSAPPHAALAAAVPSTIRRGLVSAIVPDADPLSRLFPVRVRLENADGSLRPGMSITGLVPTGAPEQAITVHRDAVLHGGTGAYVFFNAGGTSAIAPVTILYPSGTRLVIKSDTLKPGMTVVVEGNERLRPGQPLAVQGEAAKPGG